MKVCRVSQRVLRALRVVGVLALLGVLQAPVYAQFPDRPQITASQILMPDHAEFTPAPGEIRPLRFGQQVTRHDNTALVWEEDFPGPGGASGRVAVFTRNAQRTWVRSASIDAPRGIIAFGQQMALFNNFALIESSANAFLYQRVEGKWKLMQRLAPQSGYQFRDLTIWNNWAFIGAASATAGAVHVYQFTTAGTLRGVQTLRSYSGDPADQFGTHVVISNARVLVSASGDSNGRGAAYVFELSGSLFVKRQKLIAINGRTTDRFATTLGISADWIAIGAPDVEGPLDGNCVGGRNTGAIYVFKRTNGTWLQQDVLLSGDARDSRFTCVNELGTSVVISGAWIVGTVTFPQEPAGIPKPMIFKRDAANFTPRGSGDIGDGAEIDLHLSNGVLLVGQPTERGCNFEACIGQAFVFDLEKAGL
jgi:hypothetical protein